MEETDVVIDIESSTNTNTINETRIPDVANDKDGSILVSSMIYGRPIGGDELLGEGENPVKIVGGVSPNAKKEKRMSMSAKKPPRPPRGLSLDAADQKLIKEISELAMIKRARIERMKALKKMKAAKAVSSASASSSGNFIAMMFTILFCVVILFQGNIYFALLLRDLLIDFV